MKSKMPGSQFCMVVSASLMAIGNVAGSTAQMTLTSAGNNVVGNVYVNPYFGTVNGVPTVIICDDWGDDTYLGESWTANVYAINDTSNTRNTQKWSLTAAQQMQDYTEAAFLATKLLSATDPAVAGEISYALWEIFDPGAFPALNA